MPDPLIHLLYDAQYRNLLVPNGLHPRHRRTWAGNAATHHHAFNVLTRHYSATDTLRGYFPLVLRASRFDHVEKPLGAANPNDVNWLVVEPSDIDTSFVTQNCLAQLSQRARQAVRSGIVTLIIYYAFEGHSFSYREWMSTLERTLVRLGIPPEHVRLIYGDLNARANYVNHIESNTRYYPWRLENIIPFSHFELEMQHYVKTVVPNCDTSSPQCVRTLCVERCDPRPYVFLSYNGGGRPHRLYFLAEASRRGCMKHGLVSYLAKYQDPYDPSKLLMRDDPDLESKTNYHRSYVQSLRPMHLDHDRTDDTWHNRGTIGSHYEQTYLSVVTETFPPRPSFFITEKVFKPILNLHPFLVLSSPGTLAWLRGRGYDTFPELFDESYDTIQDDALRFDSVMTQLTNIIDRQHEIPGLYRAILPRLIQNRERLLNRSFAAAADKLITSILRPREHLDSSIVGWAG